MNANRPHRDLDDIAGRRGQIVSPRDSPSVSVGLAVQELDDLNL